MVTKKRQHLKRLTPKKKLNHLQKDEQQNVLMSPKKNRLVQKNS